MYEKFFGLSRDPFSIAPDPRYLFMSERHREALAHLLYGLDAGGGFVLLSGEIGTGKTTVCRCFLEQIPPNCNVAYIFNPRLTVLELLHSVCEEFHVPLPPGAQTAKALIDPLNTFLLNAHAAGRNNVLIIDEAQNLSSDILEQLRLLTNLETNERKLLQIILIGQPELRGMLARPELEQLAQRVIARFHLDALSQAETADYVAHRLAVAGMNGPLPFDKKALAHIYQLSRGVPRRINLLCGRALLGAYAGGLRQVGKAPVDKAAAEVFGSPQLSSQKIDPRPRSPLLPVVIACTIGAAIGAALVGAGVNAWPFSSSLSASVSKPLPTSPQSPAPVRLPPAAVVQSLPAIAASSATAPAQASRPSATLSDSQLAAALAASTESEHRTWAVLGQFWGLSLAGTNNIDTCEAAAAQQVRCYSNSPVNLSLIRQLDRPGILTLYAAGNRPVYALLTGLTPQTATLKIDNITHTVPLPMLTQTWTGSFATLWRTPTDVSYFALQNRTLASTVWLGNQLGRLSGNAPPLSIESADQRDQLEATVRSRITAFQLAHGLPPDSIAGPMTLMQLNRALGVSEPRLQNDKP